jgi:myo-inositol 2-dehydrogenase / D-chiro-inositol 1-dehydrogenase
VRVLVVGAGRMGSIRVEDLAANPKVTEILVSNRNSEKAEALAGRFGAKVLPWSDLALADIEGAVVAVGTSAHEEVLQAILPGGIPVLCEKPIALTLDGTKRAIELADQFQSPLQIGFQRRFDEEILEVRKAVASGSIGTLYSMTMTAHDKEPSPREFIDGSGGIFRDMHVHDFDLIRFLTGTEVVRVFATKAVLEHTQYVEFDDADVSSVIAETSSGAQILITGTRHDALGHDIRLEAFGSKDSISAGLNTRTPLRSVEGEVNLNQNPYQGFVDRFRAAFKNETDAFVSFALGEIENPCPPDSAVESLRIAEACEMSVRTGSFVLLSEVS